jgi:glycosyltransferase involved in cell wall biosynthesis
LNLTTKPTIAFYLPNLEMGGSEQVAVTLANELTLRGIRVDMVLSRSRGELLQQLHSGVNIINLNANTFRTSFWPLVTYLKKYQPSALLSWMDFSNVFAVLAAKLAKPQPRVAIRIPTTLSRNIKPPIKNIFARLLFHFIYPLADTIISVSGGAADDLARFAWLSRSRIQVVYNPIISQELIAKSAQPLDDPWFYPGHPPVILAVGRLSPAKDYPTLLNAFAILRQKVAANLLILGEGSLRKKLEVMIHELELTDSVRLPGLIMNPFPYMSNADVFVLSSVWEGLPGTLIQAMACGCPVISTDCPSGPSETLGGGRYGTLVPPGKPVMLAEAIIHSLENEPPHIPDEWLQQFTTRVAVQKYIDALQINNSLNV